jgi:DNA-binding winged helix-turn-helix (wHTH) protein
MITHLNNHPAVAPRATGSEGGLMVELRGTMYVFGAYELDLQRYELRRAGEPLPLEPKVFDVLTYLVQHCDRLVSKDELLERLWCGANVGEAALVRCIVAARKAIGERPETPRIIQTVRGRGYRFVAPVTIATPTTTRGAVIGAQARGLPFRPLCGRLSTAVMVEDADARLRYIACMKQGPWRVRQAHR